MGDWIVIVDNTELNYPSSLQKGYDGDLAQFISLDEIKRERNGWGEGNFVWWAFNYKTGEVVKIE